MKSLALMSNLLQLGGRGNEGPVPIHIILVVIGLVLFLFAAVPFWYTPDTEPHRLKLVALGLFFVVLAGFWG